MWQRDFGGDPNVVGRTMNSQRIFRIRSLGCFRRASDRCRSACSRLPPPSSIVPSAKIMTQKCVLARHLRAIARLKAGVTVSEAQSDMSVVTSHLTAQYPADDSDYSVRIVPMKEDLVGDLRPALLMLFGAAAFVLLVACSNVASLLLARETVRQREIALRCALARAPRLLQQRLNPSFFVTGRSSWRRSRFRRHEMDSGVFGEKVFPALNGVEMSWPVLVSSLPSP